MMTTAFNATAIRAEATKLVKRLEAMPGVHPSHYADLRAALDATTFEQAVAAARKSRTLPPETPNDREALREQIQRESALQAWRERGVL